MSSGRLELTDEQQKKLAEIDKDMQAKQSELRSGMRDATQEQRREVFQKLRKLRSDADEKALGLLTAEQKEAFEKMKGEKIELPTRRGRQSTTDEFSRNLKEISIVCRGSLGSRVPRSRLFPFDRFRPPTSPPSMRPVDLVQHRQSLERGIRTYDDTR